jgi:hypothetical protein
MIFIKRIIASKPNEDRSKCWVNLIQPLALAENRPSALAKPTGSPGSNFAVRRRRKEVRRKEDGALKPRLPAFACFLRLLGLFQRSALY